MVFAARMAGIGKALSFVAATASAERSFAGGKVQMERPEPAQSADLHECNAIICAGRDFQMEQGFTQWTVDYPSLGTIRADIEAKNGYVIKADGRIAGYMCVDFGGKSACGRIRGMERAEAVCGHSQDGVRKGPQGERTEPYSLAPGRGAVPFRGSGIHPGGHGLPEHADAAHSGEKRIPEMRDGHVPARGEAGLRQNPVTLREKPGRLPVPPVFGFPGGHSMCRQCIDNKTPWEYNAPAFLERTYGP